MLDLLLIPALAAIVAFGGYLVNKLDVFLESNCQAQVSLSSAGEHSLRIGLSNPLAAEDLSDVLEMYSKIRPDVSARFFGGTAEELMKGLSARKLDVIFLPEDAEIPDKLHHNVREVSLNASPIIMQYAGLSIEPIAEGHLSQKILWQEAGITPAVGSFMECLENAAMVRNCRNSQNGNLVI